MVWCQVVSHSFTPYQSMNRLVASMQTSMIIPSTVRLAPVRNAGSTPTPMCRYSR